MFKKIISFFTAVCTVMLCMCACTPDKSSDKVSLKLWTRSPARHTAEKMVKAFEKENSDISISCSVYNQNPEYIEALQGAVGTGDFPDIIAIYPGADCLKYKEYLIDLRAYAEKEWGENRTGNDSEYKVIPIENQNIYIEYNRTLFESLDIDVPTTYEELSEAADKLKENDIIPLYFGGADRWQHINLFVMCTTQIDRKLLKKCLAGEKSWLCDEMMKALKNYKKLFDDGIIQENCLTSTTYNDGTRMFLAGRVGMMVLGSWWTQEFTVEDGVTDAVANWDYDYFYLPAISEGLSDSPPIGGIDFGYGITTSCKNPEAAWKAIVNFACGSGAREMANDLNNHLSMSEIEPDIDAMSDAVRKRAGLKKAVNEFKRSGKDMQKGLVTLQIENPELEEALHEALQGIVAGDYNVRQAAKHMQDIQDGM